MFYFFFSIGIKILFLLTTIFYVVYFIAVLQWAEKKITFIVVPILYTFKFFLIGFFVVLIISILLNYIPIALQNFPKTL
ncbi:MAG: hypothetical protein COU98_01890 [Candidatus Staskawiczbacteria bacterium CG10_big_fil_rev_8_21_14_0_10_38_10]|uniref:Uncharacterized protein n=1 Tax=Candidatus Staskawiczbacteria bacterium CG10_big_fil_rev_8_21_14_0_10_38_10 TaxID=1974891 RepID=A0A2H9T177_9BACT|nr:MAG: hypothetical protein COU98_01890 [Candidatus Staskawiczbacteria bacterium CG10_big_fil_rev_8_21_14_0_10_38_10]